jgi:hypothetical protein
MLIAEVNGVAAEKHPAARLFVESGFVATALGLQARPPTDGSPAGTRVAGISHRRIPMADTNRDPLAQTPDDSTDSPTDDLNREGITSAEDERERVRASNDRDQELEREGIESRHNRGYDQAATGEGNPTDPDSAFSEVDRDDTVG